MSTHHKSSDVDLAMSDRRIYRVAAGTTIVIAICAALLSYSALRELAIQSGIEGTLAYLFPLILDGLILIGALMVLFAATRGRRSWGGFFLTGLGVVSSVAGNVAISPETLTARLVHAAAPVVLFLGVEAVTSLMRKMRNESLEARDELAKTTVNSDVPIASAAEFFTGATAPTKNAFMLTPDITSSVEATPIQSPTKFEQPVVASIAALDTVEHFTASEDSSNAVTMPGEEPSVETFANARVSTVAPDMAESYEDTQHDVPTADATPLFEVSGNSVSDSSTTLQEDMVTPSEAASSSVDNTPETSLSSSDTKVTTLADLKIRPDMTARQRVTAYIEAGYHDISFIADKIDGDRKYIRKLAREELDRRGLVAV